MIGDRELVGRRAAQPDDVPDVGPGHLARAHQHGPLDRPAVAAELGRAVGLEDRAWQPSQVACRPPEAKAQIPVTL